MYIILFVCLTDFTKLFRLLDSLEGTADECCACIRTVIHEAERFKRHALSEKLKTDFLEQRLSAPVCRLSATVVSTAESSIASSTSTLSRTSDGLTVNCNHQPDAV